MADNTQLSASTGSGDIIRTVHKSTYKTPVSLIDVGGTSTGTESILGDSTHALPVKIMAGTTVQPVSLTTASTVHAVVSGSTVSVSGSTVSVSGSTVSVSPLTTATTIHAIVSGSTLSVSGSTVSVSGSTISGTFASADDAAFTPGTGIGTPIMGLVTSDEVSTGDVGVLQMTTGRILKVCNFDSTGGELVQVTTLSVSNNGTFQVQVSNFTTAVSLLIDGAHGDDAIFTPTTSKGVAIMGVVTDDTVSTGDVGAVAMSQNRILKVAVFSSTGVEQSIGGGTQYAIGTTGSTGDTVTVAGVYRKDTPATLADTTGDVTGLQADSEGKLWVNTSRSTQPVTLTTASTVSVNGLVSVSGSTINVHVVSISGTTSQAVTVTTASTIHAAQSGTWNVGTLALTNGGCSPYSFIGTTAYHTTTVKVTSGQVYGLSAFNWSFTKCFLKIYDTSAAPTTGDTAIHRVLIPASTVNGGAGVVNQTFPGIAFSNGIGYKLTGAIADGDTSVAWSTASEGCINLLYK